MLRHITRRSVLGAGAALGTAALAGAPGLLRAQGAGPVRVIMQAHPATDALKALAPEWSAQSGIEVQVEDLGAEQLLDKLRLTLSAGSDSYDVIGLFLDLVAQYEQAGWIEDLRPHVGDLVDDPDFVRSFVEGLTSNGRTVGLPFYGESTSLTFNRTHFAEAGLEAPPATFEELRDYAAALTDPARNRYGITLRGLRSGQNLIYIWTGFFRGFGGEYFDDDLEPIFDSDAGVQAAEFYAELIRNYAPPGTGTAAWDVVQGHMQQGLASMNIDATNFGVQFEDPEKSLVAGQIGYAEVPAGPAGAFPSLFTYGLAIPSASSRKEQAAAFIRWATGPEFQLASVEQQTRGDVTRASVWEAMATMPRYGFDEGRWAQTTLSAMSKGSPDYRPRLPEWPAAADIISIAVSSVIAGEADARGALARAADEVRTLMGR